MFLALDSANESQYFEIAVTQAKRKEKLFEALAEFSQRECKHNKF